LHFGSLLAALASYCDARQHRGKWLLRIEDVDESRACLDAIDHIKQTLQRYGFHWDDEAPRQSARTAIYQKALDSLIAQKQVYPCACSRLQLRDAAIGVSGERIYPGYCKRTPPDATRAPFAWRVIVPDKTFVFHDRAQGKQTQNLARDCGDFVLKRRDRYFAYHWAVVIDDTEQGITDVVRGGDILPLTARHLFLYELIGVTPPNYLHIPIAMTNDGQKLSKQTLAPPLPDDALPVLLEAWRFLGQPQLSPQPKTVEAFWESAPARWDVAAIP
jgi:glutamyl-Q tRNA(Asp) synthetase